MHILYLNTDKAKILVFVIPSSSYYMYRSTQPLLAIIS